MSGERSNLTWGNSRLLGPSDKPSVTDKGRFADHTPSSAARADDYARRSDSSVLFSSWFGPSSTDVFVAQIKILPQFVCISQQSIGNRHVFLHYVAVRLKQCCLVLLQKLFSFVFGKPESQRAGWIQIGKHVTVQGGVRIGRTLPFDLRIGCDQLFIKSQFVGGNIVLRHAHIASLSLARRVLVPLDSTSTFLAQFNVRPAARACT